MRQRYLEGEALRDACIAGQGIIVIVEGETDRDDAWFYRAWFGGLAREIQFFPQNGWSKVLTAVRELREALPFRPIYGIIDRDFFEQALVDAQFETCPSDGIFRTPYYTLENALLDPVGWLKVAHFFGRGPVTGWETIQHAEAHVDEARRRCLPVAAFNRVVYDEHARSSAGRQLAFLHHPNAAVDAAARLRAWGEERAAPHDLGDAFERCLVSLMEMPSDQHGAHVSGKAVLIALCDRLNEALPRGVPPDYLANQYLSQHPTPPPALVKLIETIMRYAGR